MKQYRPYRFFGNRDEIQPIQAVRHRKTLNSTCYLRHIGAAAAISLTVAMSGTAAAQTTSKELSEQGEAQFLRGKYAEAAEPLRKAAELGEAKAQLWLGMMYARGAGVEKNCDASIALLLKAANQRLARAEGALGVAYYEGICARVDHAAAAKWMQRAADQGLAAAQAQLGAMYLRGEGVKQDYKIALRWLEKSLDHQPDATEPNPAAINAVRAETQYFIGLMHEQGLGVPKNLALATNWLQKAAEAGNVKAKARLAELQEPLTAKAGAINLTCQGPRGRVLISIDPASRKVTLQGGGVLEYKDDQAQYVTITDAAIEFGCRTVTDETALMGEIANNMFNEKAPKKDVTKTMACLSRNRIDRTTGVWTAQTSGKITGNRVETADCSLLPTKRQF